MLTLLFFVLAVLILLANVASKYPKREPLYQVLLVTLLSFWTLSGVLFLAYPLLIEFSELLQDPPPLAMGWIFVFSGLFGLLLLFPAVRQALSRFIPFDPSSTLA